MSLHASSGRWRLGLALALITALCWATLPVALKLTLDGGWAMNPVRFSQGLYGLGIVGSSWRASTTGKGTGEAVIRCQLQLLF